MSEERQTGLGWPAVPAAEDRYPQPPGGATGPTDLGWPAGGDGLHPVVAPAAEDDTEERA